MKIEFFLCLVAVAASLSSVVYAAIDVYVMLPLDVISSSMTIKNVDNLKAHLNSLKSIGVAGVMSDCWFGLVEQTEGAYNFAPYVELTKLTRDAGLKIQYVMSFHKCGGNVGDDCNIPLPQWVLGTQEAIWYQDQHGNVDTEYISLFVDEVPTIGQKKRTPIQVYSEFMLAFKSSMTGYLGSTITEIQVGAGPCGELRYPSYQLDKWAFCGVGEFQSYSSYALSSLKMAASSVGHPEWASSGGPNNAGTYNSYPVSTGFFNGNNNDNFRSEYGRFYLNWYASSLEAHGERVLSAAASVFHSVAGVHLSLKVAGIHWWYFDASHAAELTAGYYNIPGTYDSYGKIAKLCATYNTTFDFTCLEMKDSEQPASCACGPYELVGQTKASAMAANARYSGENALQRYDTTAYGTVKAQSTTGGHDIEAFTYLRMTDALFSGSNWQNFCAFVSDMKKL